MSWVLIESRPGRAERPLTSYGEQWLRILAVVRTRIKMKDQYLWPFSGQNWRVDSEMWKVHPGLRRINRA